MVLILNTTNQHLCHNQSILIQSITVNALATQITRSTQSQLKQRNQSNHRNQHIYYNISGILLIVNSPQRQTIDTVEKKTIESSQNTNGIFSNIYKKSSTELLKQTQRSFTNWKVGLEEQLKLESNEKKLILDIKKITKLLVRLELMGEGWAQMGLGRP
jgi:hypothetical protein